MDHCASETDGNSRDGVRKTSPAPTVSSLPKSQAGWIPGTPFENMGVCHIQAQRARMNGTDNYLLIVPHCGICRGGFDPFLRHIAVNSHKALPGLQAASAFKSEAGEIELAACLTEPSSTPEAMFKLLVNLCLFFKHLGCNFKRGHLKNVWFCLYNSTLAMRNLVFNHLYTHGHGGCSTANGGLRFAIPN